MNKINRSYNDQPVLKAVDMTFEQGKIYALVGENGSGKTTLLETLALLEPPQAGTLLFQDDQVNFNASLLNLRQQIAFCLQQPYIFRTSVFNNIAFGLKTSKEEKVARISRIFGLAELLNKKATALSGGEAQKVALARTFVLETPVILLDEPTANLDETSIEQLNQLLSEVKNRGTTVILASHRLNNAFKLADEVITLEDSQAFPQSHQNFFSGQIIRENSLKTLKINEQVSFILATEKQGNVKVSIDPKEIIVSKEKFQSSARNCLLGKVRSITDEGKIAKLTADCGIKLVSQITHRSLEELGINVGQQVYLTFKTSSIKVY
ncbi:MAG: ATP-binding cassette domain-containing protein [Candidatus Margulisbacteria bacterium]|nr:ATP-binding cassette domain-containing protein [Candidatus Margulisiibacteriota bacterium]